MKKVLVVSLLGIFLFSACSTFSGPTRKDPYEGLEISATPACPDLVAAIVFSENTKESFEYGKKGTAMAGFDMTPGLEKDVEMLKNNFKKVVKVDKMADAAAINPDLIIIIDNFAEVGTSIKLESKLIIFDSNQQKIDTISAEAEDSFGFSGSEKVVFGVWDSVRNQLARGLHASKPLAAYAKSRAPEEAVAAAPAGKKSAAIVAVFDIQDASKKHDKDAMQQLTNYLGTLLTQSGSYKVIPQDQLRQNLLDEKKGSYKECFDERCRIELGKALSAEKTLATTLIQVGSKCAVTSNLFDLKTETTDKGASVETGCSPDELLSAMKSIAGQLSK
jgi:hypothetical protein